MIIEDEPLIALDLERLVTELGHRVVKIARTERQAIEAVKRARPGLILADIQLADGSSGLDAVNEILRTFSVPVIFVTAYPQRLLTGTRPEPTFLIAKPFHPDNVKAIDQPGAVLRHPRPARAAAPGYGVGATDLARRSGRLAAEDPLEAAGIESGHTSGLTMRGGGLPSSASMSCSAAMRPMLIRASLVSPPCAG